MESTQNGQDEYHSILNRIMNHKSTGRSVRVDVKLHESHCDGVKIFHIRAKQTVIPFHLSHKQ